MAKYTPIYRTAGFGFETLEEAKEAFEKEKTFPQSAGSSIYTRYGNPTVISAESALSDIEGSGWSKLTSSGMAAIELALNVFHVANEDNHILFLAELYGGTILYIEEILEKRRGIQCSRIDPDGETYTTEKICSTIENLRPNVFFFEPITNPLLICVDVEAVIATAKKVGCRVVVDNTFATSHLIKPLELGADIVVHSATKYLGGHGDITAGVISGNDRSLEREVLNYRKITGSILSPDDASRLESYLKTFNLRIRQHNENAQIIAEYLHDDVRVDTVRYPGLANHATNSIATKLFGNLGYGGVITFDLAGSNQSCKDFINNVIADIRYAPTLGDADSNLLHVRSTFGDRYGSRSIRLSVGIEPPEAIISSLDAALG